MAGCGFERLSAQDMSFLMAECDTAPMHVGGMAILEAEPLRGAGGGIDVRRYRAAVEGVLHRIPRYRQRLAWTPIEGWAVWIDDRHFNIGNHIHHIALPKPGSQEQLRELASRIFARPLDRSRPLWEIWVVEGVEDGEQFALLNKIHHCMIDGAAGAGLAEILLSPSPDAERDEAMPYLPRPEPSESELLLDAIRHRAALPGKALRAARDWLGANGAEPLEDVKRHARVFADLIGSSIRPASETPLGGELSADRRFGWLTMPLEDVKELRRELGCTINDIVLATVAGAAKRYLSRRRVDTSELDFRVLAPVNVRRKEHEGQLGNHVSSWIVPMPVDETDALERVSRLRDETAKLKESGAACGVEGLMAAAEWMTPGLLASGVGLAQGPVNMIVTNVPGPQFPLYSVGSKMLGLYPAVPLLPGSGLGVALFSYEGRLCWGFNADAHLVPDLDAFVADIGASFEELRGAVVAQHVASRTAEPETAPPVAEVAKPLEPEEKPAENELLAVGSERTNSGVRHAPEAGAGDGDAECAINAERSQAPSTLSVL